jgi:spore coat polysaccharide biosynthesis protein SpsF (cytidylyltransferase family)
MLTAEGLKIIGRVFRYQECAFSIAVWMEDCPTRSREEVDHALDRVAESLKQLDERIQGAVEGVRQEVMDALDLRVIEVLATVDEELDELRTAIDALKNAQNEEAHRE